MDNENISIKASNARKTSYGVDGGMDVDVVVTVGGVELPAGEVTLVPDAINGGWMAYGYHPSMWVSGKLLAALPDDDGDCLTLIRLYAERAIERAE